MIRDGGSSNGKICIIPNPAPAGSTVDIYYIGDGEVQAHVFGEDGWESVPIDSRNGHGTFEVPGSAELIAFSDREYPVPSEEILEVEERAP